MRDHLSIRVVSGRGGDGCASFRREKFIPRGGPDGGDGGRGGHVYVRVKEKLTSLELIRNNSMYKAGAGAAGSSVRKHGKHGDDLFIDVPPGTSVFDDETDTLIGELVSKGDKLLLVEGGLGGRGNCHFATPQNRAPREFEPGRDADERNVRFSYSIPADVAILGFPGSGKSALLGRLTNSRTKIGTYPFTTRSPHVGMIRINPFTLLKTLDLPALVEGSFEGKGIGNHFLMHLHRVKVILFLLDPVDQQGIEPGEQLEILRREVRMSNPDFASKKEVVALNKIDALDPGGERDFSAVKCAEGQPFLISAIEGTGIDELIGAVADMISSDEESD